LFILVLPRHSHPLPWTTLSHARYVWLCLCGLVHVTSVRDCSTRTNAHCPRSWLRTARQAHYSWTVSSRFTVGLLLGSGSFIFKGLARDGPVAMDVYTLCAPVFFIPHGILQIASAATRWLSSIGRALSTILRLTHGQSVSSISNCLPHKFYAMGEGIFNPDARCRMHIWYRVSVIYRTTEALSPYLH